MVCWPSARSASVRGRLRRKPLALLDRWVRRRTQTYRRTRREVGMRDGGARLPRHRQTAVSGRLRYRCRRGRPGWCGRPGAGCVGHVARLLGVRLRRLPGISRLRDLACGCIARAFPLVHWIAARNFRRVLLCDTVSVIPVHTAVEMCGLDCAAATGECDAGDGYAGAATGVAARPGSAGKYCPDRRYRPRRQ